MKYLASSAEMQEIDRRTIEEIGIPGLVLMERAAYAVFLELEKMVACRTSFGHGETSGAMTHFLIVAEGGNNGGDGLAVARMLYEKGYHVDVYYIGGLKKESDSFKKQMDIIRQLEIPVYSELPDGTYDFIIDGIFGVGLSRDITGIQLDVINRLNNMSGIRVAIDIPSGVNSTTGSIMGAAFRADVTVTFGLLKAGMVFYPGSDYCGKIAVAQIGFPSSVMEAVKPCLYTYDTEDLKQLPARRNASNKGSYGRVAVIAGSRDISGAAVFAAKAAYRTGSGLVKVYTHERNRDIICTLVPEALIMTYHDEASAVSAVSDAMAYGDTLLTGPGLGKDALSHAIFAKVVSEYKKTLIIDADGLNILAENMDLLKYREGATIVTPHLKEMERLSGIAVHDIKGKLPEFCREFANRYHVVCVLKDARTCVSDGSCGVYVNTTGNNGMSTGGTGDVLAGMIAALSGMGATSFEAAKLGVYIHGLAGDYALQEKGSYGMIAGDVADSIPYVLGGNRNGQNI